MKIPPVKGAWVCISVALCAAPGFAADNLPAESLLDRFGAADDVGRRHLLADMDRAQVAVASIDDLEKTLELATHSSSPAVRSAALDVLTKLLERDAPAVKRIAHPGFLASLVSDADEDGALAALELSSVLHGVDSEVSVAAEARLQAAPIEPRLDARIVRALPRWAAPSAQTLGLLMDWAKNQQDALGFESIVATAKLGKLLPESASSILRVAATPEFFAHPELISQLTALAPLSKANLDEFLSLKRRFDSELAKPRLERSVAIYNDALYRSVLDKTASEIISSQR